MLHRFCLFFVLFLALNQGAAFACAARPTLSQELQRSDAVFSGKVIHTSRFWHQDPTVTFDVERIWKGDNQALIRVTMRGLSGSPNAYSQMGEEYLVYASGKDRLETHICTRTIALNMAQEDLRVLGKGKAAPPLPPRPYKTLYVSLILATGIFTACFVMRTKRPSQTRDELNHA